MNQLSLGVSTEPVSSRSKENHCKGARSFQGEAAGKRTSWPHTTPSILRREEIIIEPSEDVSGCTRLEDEVTEVLEVKAAEFYVKRYVRRKYVRQAEEGIAIGKLPTRAIDKGIPGASVLAMLLVGKFVDHLPIYRQIAIFKHFQMNYIQI